MRPLKPWEIVLEDWQEALPVDSQFNPLYDKVIQWCGQHQNRCPPELGAHIREVLHKKDLTNDDLRELLKIIYGDEGTNLEDYKYRGQFITTAVALRVWGIKGATLSRDPEAKLHRRKAPGGRTADGGDYVYRRMDAERIADRTGERAGDRIAKQIDSDRKKGRR